MSHSKSNKNGAFFPTVLSDFFDTDKFFGNRWTGRDFTQGLPAVNIRENNNEFNIEFAAPGFSKNDFKVNIEGTMLTVNAEKQSESKEEKGHYTRQEFSYNSFTRSFNLPENVNADKMEAKYNDGILKLNIPKKEKTKTIPKKTVKVI